MNNERYVAAIEISSSKITAAVGRMAPNGVLHVVAVEQEKGNNAVRYGIIQNLEETSNRIARVLENLERRAAIAPRLISSVFVGLSGRSLRSIETSVTINLPEETEINREIVDRLEKEALNTNIDDSLDIVDAVPRCFRVGNSETLSPIGMLGNRIEATFDLIVCRPEMKRNIVRTLCEKLKLEIAGYIVTPLAVGQIILTSNEKRLGCMLADIGAETTTVTIYKNDRLNYFATLPLGSRDITLDLTSLNILEENAEEIKTTSGNAIASSKPSTMNLSGLKYQDVSDIIVARSEELVVNIVEQLSYAGLKSSDIPAGIICVGGGSSMHGMTDLINLDTNRPAQRGRLPEYIRIDDLKVHAFELIQICCVLYAAASNTDIDCLVDPAPRPIQPIGEPNEDPETYQEINDVPDHPQAKPRTPGKFSAWGSRFKSGLGRLFGTDVDSDDDTDLM